MDATTAPFRFIIIDMCGSSQSARDRFDDFLCVVKRGLLAAEKQLAERFEAAVISIDALSPLLLEMVPGEQLPDDNNNNNNSTDSSKQRKPPAMTIEGAAVAAAAAYADGAPIESFDRVLGYFVAGGHDAIPWSSKALVLRALVHRCLLRNWWIFGDELTLRCLWHLAYVGGHVLHVCETLTSSQSVVVDSLAAAMAGMGGSSFLDRGSSITSMAMIASAAGGPASTNDGVAKCGRRKGQPHLSQSQLSPEESPSPTSGDGTANLLSPNDNSFLFSPRNSNNIPPSEKFAALRPVTRESARKSMIKDAAVLLDAASGIAFSFRGREEIPPPPPPVDEEEDKNSLVLKWAANLAKEDRFFKPPPARPPVASISRRTTVGLQLAPGVVGPVIPPTPSVVGGGAAAVDDMTSPSPRSLGGAGGGTEKSILRGAAAAASASASKVGALPPLQAATMPLLGGPYSPVSSTGGSVPSPPISPSSSALRPGGGLSQTAGPSLGSMLKTPREQQHHLRQLVVGQDKFFSSSYAAVEQHRALLGQPKEEEAKDAEKNGAPPRLQISRSRDSINHWLFFDTRRRTFTIPTPQPKPAWILSPQSGIPSGWPAVDGINILASSLRGPEIVSCRTILGFNFNLTPEPMLISMAANFIQEAYRAAKEAVAALRVTTEPTLPAYVSPIERTLLNEWRAALISHAHHVRIAGSRSAEISASLSFVNYISPEELPTRKRFRAFEFDSDSPASSSSTIAAGAGGGGGGGGGASNASVVNNGSGSVNGTKNKTGNDNKNSQFPAPPFSAASGMTATNNEHTIQALLSARDWNNLNNRRKNNDDSSGKALVLNSDRFFGPHNSVFARSHPNWYRPTISAISTAVASVTFLPGRQNSELREVLFSSNAAASSSETPSGAMSKLIGENGEELVEGEEGDQYEDDDDGIEEDGEEEEEDGVNDDGSEENVTQLAENGEQGADGGEAKLKAPRRRRNRRNLSSNSAQSKQNSQQDLLLLKKGGSVAEGLTTADSDKRTSTAQQQQLASPHSIEEEDLTKPPVTPPYLREWRKYRREAVEASGALDALREVGASPPRGGGGGGGDSALDDTNAALNASTGLSGTASNNSVSNNATQSNLSSSSSSPNRRFVEREAQKIKEAARLPQPSNRELFERKQSSVKFGLIYSPKGSSSKILDEIEGHKKAVEHNKSSENNNEEDGREDDTLSSPFKHPDLHKSTHPNHTAHSSSHHHHRHRPAGVPQLQLGGKIQVVAADKPVDVHSARSALQWLSRRPEFGEAAGSVATARRPNPTARPVPFLPITTTATTTTSGNNNEVATSSPTKGESGNNNNNNNSPSKSPSKNAKWTTNNEPHDPSGLSLRNFLENSVAARAWAEEEEYAKAREKLLKNGPTVVIHVPQRNKWGGGSKGGSLSARNATGGGGGGGGQTMTNFDLERQPFQEFRSWERMKDKESRAKWIAGDFKVSPPKERYTQMPHDSGPYSERRNFVRSEHRERWISPKGFHN